MSAFRRHYRPAYDGTRPVVQRSEDDRPFEERHPLAFGIWSAFLLLTGFAILVAAWGIFG